MKNKTLWLWITVVVATFATLMVIPRFTISIDKTIGSLPIKIDQTIGEYDIDINVFGLKFQRDLKFQPGLDLQGGTQVTLEADMSAIDPTLRKDALESVQSIISRRVNFLGVTEPNVYTSVSNDSYRVVVELPGISDEQQVISVIGQTAQLDFREQYTAEETAQMAPDQQAEWKKTELTGEYLKGVQVVYEPTTGFPAVQLTFNEDGSQLFEDITRRNIDKTVAIFIDDRAVTIATVSQAIAGGVATISRSGGYPVDEAKSLTVQLNAGALPAPVSVISQQTVGPTLGQQTVEKSIVAGLVGVLLIAVFMLINYRLFGLFSIIGLTIYGLLTLAVYKYIPVTITLSGLTGFILSLGMAVDANILIFERIREEQRAGRATREAISVGFTRAWESIRDANTATLITVFILFNPFDWSFLVTSGTVRGFAVTLGIGVVLSLFTGVRLTRALIYNFYPMGQSNKLGTDKNKT
ncbi:protein translocase subunit SecD [candidate division WWE3 bacterium CG_4_10_14_0_2_um_filter_41_14]|uniref:Protein translocase subunit SecD n=1 Tax=candidate division WWE3 bacterium CG_4_10_14_0_2_um_filter_41_14 TaxID=1975072 RepID=A0A2M7TIG9_UNCKA|nr:MAG: protein translocase subunit SecD [candidate division WWE3 bacterium CG_4_10_14_0_2_um_filter_41_14]